MATPPDASLADRGAIARQASTPIGRRAARPSPIAETDGELIAQFLRRGGGGAPRSGSPREAPSWSTSAGASPTGALPPPEVAFARLLDRHGAMVWRVCRRVLNHPQDAEDAFQATFLILARRGRSIRASESVAGWLYRVAYRTAMTAKRRAKKRREAPLETDPPAPAETAFPDLVGRQTAGVLMEELDRLPAKYRTPLVMRYLEGCSRRAIADQTDTTIAAVQGRLARGKQILRSRLVRRGVSLSAAMAVVAVGSAEAAPTRLAAQTTASATALATGGSVAASAATLSLYREGVRAMLLSSIGKPVAAAAGVGVVLAALAAPPALFAADKEAAPGLTLSAEVVADETAVEAAPAQIAQRTEIRAATVRERPDRRARIVGSLTVEEMDELRGQAQLAVRLATGHQPGGYDFVVGATPEKIFEAFPGAQGELVLEAKRLLDEINERYPEVATAEARRTIAEVRAALSGEASPRRQSGEDAARNGSESTPPTGVGDSQNAVATTPSDGVEGKLREKILDLLAHIPGVRVQVGVSGEDQADAMASIVVPEVYAKAIHRERAEGDQSNDYAATQKDVRHQIQRLVNPLLPRLEPDEDEYLRIEVEFASTPVLNPSGSAAVAYENSPRYGAYSGRPTVAGTAQPFQTDPARWADWQPAPQVGSYTNTVPTPFPVPGFPAATTQYSPVSPDTLRFQALEILDGGEEVRFRGKVIPLEQLKSRLRSENRPEQILMVLGDRQPPPQVIAKVREAIEAEGVDAIPSSNLPLGVLPPGMPAPESAVVSQGPPPAELARLQQEMAELKGQLADAQRRLREQAPPVVPASRVEIERLRLTLDAAVQKARAELAKAEAETKKAVSNFERAGVDLRRKRKLADEGLTSQLDLQRAKEFEESIAAIADELKRRVEESRSSLARSLETRERVMRSLGEAPRVAPAAPKAPESPITAPVVPPPAVAEPPEQPAPTNPQAGWPYHPAYQYGPGSKMKQGQWNVYHRSSELNPHGWATIALLRIGEHAPIMLPGDKRPRPHVRLKSVNEADGPYTSPTLYLELIDDEQVGDSVWVINGVPDTSTGVTLPGRNQSVEVACLNEVTDKSEPILLLLRSHDPNKPAGLPTIEAAKRLLYAGNPQDETGRIDRTSPVQGPPPATVARSDGEQEETLKRGDSGPEVTRLQEWLNTMLVPSPGLAVDGDFGPETERVLKYWQQVVQTPQTGEISLVSSEELWLRLVKPKQQPVAAEAPHHTNPTDDEPGRIDRTSPISRSHRQSADMPRFVYRDPIGNKVSGGSNRSIYEPTELNPLGWVAMAHGAPGITLSVVMPGGATPNPKLRLLSSSTDDSARLRIEFEGDRRHLEEINLRRDEPRQETIAGQRVEFWYRSIPAEKPTVSPQLLLIARGLPPGVGGDPVVDRMPPPSADTALRLLYENRPARRMGRGGRSSTVAAEAPRRIDPTDGKADGKKSLGGSGHLVRFDLPEGVTRLKAIRIHGSRYGTKQAPREDFEIAVLSEDRSEILAVEHAAYGLFRRGDEKWTTVKFDNPVDVPKTFWLAIDFNPGRTKGVYFSYDTSTGGERSMTGLAQDGPSEHEPVDFGGDWMVQLLPERE